MKTIGVLLLNLGGPDSLEAVKPFLYNLFSDRDIIPLGPPLLQKPLAWLIAQLRSRKTRQMYGCIGGKSPILDLTRAQAGALEKELGTLSKGENGAVHFRVSVGMRYWRPTIEDAVGQLYSLGAEKVIALSLYPQYSRATTGSAVKQFREVMAKYPLEFICITEWFDHPLYVDALVESIKEGFGSLGDKTQNMSAPVLFSAHSLPKSIVDSGDPYVTHIMGTIHAVTEKIPIDWHLSYQSKSGPVAWLEPSTEVKIEELAHQGVRNLLIVPISFVSDHIETLYEIDILYKAHAEKFGIRLVRVPSLNVRPLFLKALKDIVMHAGKEHRWIE